MIKIFIQNKPLLLVDNITKEVEDYIHRSDTIFIDELNNSAVKTMLQQLVQPEYYAGVFLHTSVNETLDAFKSHLQLIKAAGGLVYTDKKEVLLIFRKGKWDLPKGKLDDGEDLATCALREIQEETGVSGLTIEQALQVTYHTYHHKMQHILKESHWYLVKSQSRYNLTPQIEEDIEKAEWVSFETVHEYMNNMHASIIDVTKKALDILKQF